MNNQYNNLSITKLAALLEDSNTPSNDYNNINQLLQKKIKINKNKHLVINKIKSFDKTNTPSSVVELCKLTNLDKNSIQEIINTSYTNKELSFDECFKFLPTSIVEEEIIAQRKCTVKLEEITIEFDLIKDDYKEKTTALSQAQELENTLNKKIESNAKRLDSFQRIYTKGKLQKQNLIEKINLLKKNLNKPKESSNIDSSETKKELQEALNSLSNISNELNIVKQRNNELKIQLKESNDSKPSQISPNSDELSLKLNKALEDLGKSIQENEEKEQSNKTLSKEIDELKLKKSEDTIKITMLEGHIKTLEIQNNGIKNNSNETHQNNTIEKLKNDLNDSELNLQKNMNQLSSIKNVDNILIHQTISKYLKINDQLEAKYTSEINNLNTIIQDLKKQIDSKNQQLSDLSNDLEDIQNNSATPENSVSNIAYQEKLEEINNLNSEIQTIKKNHTAQTNSLMEQNQELRDSSTKFKGLVDQLQNSPVKSAEKTKTNSTDEVVTPKKVEQYNNKQQKKQKIIKYSGIAIIIAIIIASASYFMVETNLDKKVFDTIYSLILDDNKKNTNQESELLEVEDDEMKLPDEVDTINPNSDTYESQTNESYDISTEEEDDFLSLGNEPKPTVKQTVKPKPKKVSNKKTPKKKPKKIKPTSNLDFNLMEDDDEEIQPISQAQDLSKPYIKQKKSSKITSKQLQQKVNKVAFLSSSFIYNNKTYKKGSTFFGFKVVFVAASVKKIYFKDPINHKTIEIKQG